MSDSTSNESWFVHKRPHPILWAAAYSLLCPVGFSKLLLESYREILREYKAKCLGSRSRESFVINMVLFAIFGMFTAGLSSIALGSMFIMVAFDWRTDLLGAPLMIYAILACSFFIALYLIFSGRLQRMGHFP